MITESSLTAYRTLVQPKLGEKQREVLSVFEMNPDRNLTNSELAHELDRPINCITPRVKELRDIGLIEEKEKRLCTVVRTNIRVSAWGLKLADTLF